MNAHKAEAERLLQHTRRVHPSMVPGYLAEAQVHAQLAILEAVELLSLQLMPPVAVTLGQQRQPSDG